MFHEFCFSDLYSDEEKKSMEGAPFMNESIAYSYLFRTNELIVHLNRGRYDGIDSLITREIPLDAVLFRLNVADFKNLEQFHANNSLFPSDRDYYSPSQRHRKFSDYKSHLFWELNIFDFTETIFPPIKESGSVSDSEKENAIEILKYATEEIKAITKLGSEEKKYIEGYMRMLSLEKLLDKNGLDNIPYAFRKSLTICYVGTLYAVGTDHISRKEWLEATVKHLEVKDFILANVSLLGLDCSSLVSFIAKLEADLKKNENVASLKTVRENYHIEARKLFGEEKSSIVGFLVDASITPLLVDHAMFSK